MITIKEIAKLAGVSFSTVSKALNDSPLVKPETKRKIVEIADQLGYRRNLLAKQLVTGKSRLVGLNLPKADNPMHGQLAIKLFQGCQQYQYKMVMTMTAPEQALELFQELRVDGLMFWEDVTETNPQLARRLTKLQTPVLVLGGDTRSTFPSVQIDRKKGIFQAVSHLWENGHRRIGFIGDTQEIKLSAYREALLELGLPFSPDYVISCGVTWESGYQALKNVRFHDVSPTAYVGFNNLVTRGALRALMEMNLRVPEKISLIGYDELPEMGYVEVPLTTVGPVLDEVARKAAKMMIALIEGQETDVSDVIEPVLNERQSVAKIG